MTTGVGCMASEKIGRLVVLPLSHQQVDQPQQHRILAAVDATPVQQCGEANSQARLDAVAELPEVRGVIVVVGKCLPERLGWALGATCSAAVLEQVVSDHVASQAAHLATIDGAERGRRSIYVVAASTVNATSTQRSTTNVFTHLHLAGISTREPWRPVRG